ncbi:hypothetical protein CDAR_527191 [Caerostris darwini]|uniref:Uncharacterized protein n=1 Tax=Caerostris darwini TaxID=1538125 RepID=A0AAV4WJ65_9ARAC|nr:hypothetical protein CDAR_527191 [Caerostris darwini]
MRVLHPQLSEVDSEMRALHPQLSGWNCSGKRYSPGGIPFLGEQIRNGAHVIKMSTTLFLVSLLLVYLFLSISFSLSSTKTGPHLG